MMAMAIYWVARCKEKKKESDGRIPLVDAWWPESCPYSLRRGYFKEVYCPHNMSSTGRLHVLRCSSFIRLISRPRGWMDAGVSKRV